MSGGQDRQGAVGGKAFPAQRGLRCGDPRAARLPQLTCTLPTHLHGEHRSSFSDSWDGGDGEGTCERRSLHDSARPPTVLDSTETKPGRAIKHMRHSGMSTEPPASPDELAPSVDLTMSFDSRL